MFALRGALIFALHNALICVLGKIVPEYLCNSYPRILITLYPIVWITLYRNICITLCPHISITRCAETFFASPHLLRVKYFPCLNYTVSKGSIYKDKKLILGYTSIELWFIFNKINV